MQKMQRTEQITEVAVDKDTGAPVDAWRSIVTVTATNFSGDAERTDVYYVFHWEHDQLGRPITIGADTAEQRDVMDRAYSRTMRFQPPSAEIAGVKELPYPPSHLIGRTVSSFTVATPQYTESLLTLAFGEFSLELYAVPDVTSPLGAIPWGVANYYDTLCRLIDSHLTSVDEYIDRGLVLQFSSGTLLSVVAPFSYMLEESPGIAALRGPNLFFSWSYPYDLYAPDATCSLIRAAHTVGQ